MMSITCTFVYVGQYSNCTPAMYEIFHRASNGMFYTMSLFLLLWNEHHYKKLLYLLSSAYGVECDSIGAMKSLCTFSVFMMLSYIFELIVLLKFKDDLLGNGPLDEGIGGVGAASSAGTLLPEPRGMYARVDAVSMEYG